MRNEDDFLSARKDKSIQQVPRLVTLFQTLEVSFKIWNHLYAFMVKVLPLMQVIKNLFKISTPFIVKRYLLIK